MLIAPRSEVVKMAILEGDAAKEFTEKIRLRNIQLAEESLKEEKRKAAQTGKEAFDYQKLKSFVDPDYYADAETLEKRIERLEYKYYVGNSEIMTIKEFADHIIEIYKWKE
jgi:hypothetical protein